MLIRKENFSADDSPGVTPAPAGDLTEVVKALALERDTARRETLEARAEAAKAAEVATALKGRLAEVYHAHDIQDLVHPNAAGSMPAIALGSDHQPTKESLEARAKWKADNAGWAIKAAPAPATTTGIVTPAKIGEATVVDIQYWRTMRNERPAEFRSRKAEYNTWCDQQDAITKK